MQVLQMIFINFLLRLLSEYRDINYSLEAQWRLYAIVFGASSNQFTIPVTEKVC